jgi:hypothetical protein
MPDKTETAAGDAKKTPYVLVPQLRLSGSSYLNRLSLAGWADKNGTGHACKACGKQVRLSLSELMVFPLVKVDTDMLQFVYVVPAHRTGGAFSTEICKESNTRLLRNYELPTSIRFAEQDQVPVSGEGERVEPAKKETSPTATEHEEVDKEDVKKKVQALSPQMAEERYNTLQARPISDLTDAEYAERLALVERLTEKKKEPKQDS